jgi:hypothetical protein
MAGFDIIKVRHCRSSSMGDGSSESSTQYSSPSKDLEEALHDEIVGGLRSMKYESCLECWRIDEQENVMKVDLVVSML